MAQGNQRRTRRRYGTRKLPLTAKEIKGLFEYYDGDSWWSSIFRRGRENLTQETQIKRLQEIERFYQGASKIKEIVDRHVRALLGRDIEWFLVDPNDPDNPSSQVQDFQEQLHFFLRKYQKMAASMNVGFGGKNAVEQAVTDAKICGRGYLRIYDPDRVDMPFTVHSPDPLDVEVGRDDNGYPIWIKYAYLEDLAPGADTDNKKLMVEHQTVNPENQLTEFRILESQSTQSAGYINYDSKGYQDGEVKEMWTLDLGGNFTIYEFSLESLITHDLRRLQDGLNYMVTLMLRNLGYAGLSRDTVLNGRPPGEYQRNKETGQMEYIQSGELEVIPGSQSYIAGIPIIDPNTRTISGYTTPQIVSHEPSPVDAFTNSIQAYQQLMYGLSQQGHILESGGQLSAVSRKELRHDFDAALRKDGATVGEGIASIYITILYLLNQDKTKVLEQIKSLDLSVNLNVSSGEPTPEEIQQIINLYQAGVISRKTAMARTGMVEDIDDETLLIEEEMSNFSGTPSNPLLPDPGDNPNQNGDENE